MHMLRFAVDWVDLPIIDISKANTVEGRAELASQVCDAMRTFGFMYVVNHGLTQAQVRRHDNAAPWGPSDLPTVSAALERKAFRYRRRPFLSGV